MRDFIRRHWAHITGWVAVITLVTTLGVANALPGRNTVFSDDIVNGEVKRPDIGRNAVNGAKVKNGSLTGADIRNESLTGFDVADGSLNGADIADDSIQAIDIANGAITAGELADNTVNGAKIVDGSVTGIDVANNSLGGSDIQESSLNGGQINFGCSQDGIANYWGYFDVDASGMPLNTWQYRNSGYIDSAYNCSSTSNSSVQVLKRGTGLFRVYFANSGAPYIVQAQVHYASGSPSACLKSKAVVDRVGSGQFDVWITDGGGNSRNCPFVLTLF